MKGKRYILILLLLAGIYSTCKKPYNPKIVDSPNHYLVVEGVINNGSDSTIIKLSRTVKISGTVSTSGVDNCAVSVEAEGGAAYSLTPRGSGTYVIPALNLDASKNIDCILLQEIAKNMHQIMLWLKRHNLLTA
ncbi:DUF4249 family protein [Mucilaginibacter sp. P19]|uniref:DUF4249 family protein n=1 Tax=Mucilaginibacter sp. P19 TaxID=3423947 RepID=UPI003D667019